LSDWGSVRRSQLELSPGHLYLGRGEGEEKREEEGQ